MTVTSLSETNVISEDCNIWCQKCKVLTFEVLELDCDFVV